MSKSRLTSIVLFTFITVFAIVLPFMVIEHKLHDQGVHLGGWMGAYFFCVTIAVLGMYMIGRVHGDGSIDAPSCHLNDYQIFELMAVSQDLTNDMARIIIRVNPGKEKYVWVNLTDSQKKAVKKGDLPFTVGHLYRYSHNDCSIFSALEKQDKKQRPTDLVEA